MNAKIIAGGSLENGSPSLALCFASSFLATTPVMFFSLNSIINIINWYYIQRNAFPVNEEHNCIVLLAKLDIYIANKEIPFLSLPSVPSLQVPQITSYKLKVLLNLGHYPLCN